MAAAETFTFASLLFLATQKIVGRVAEVAATPAGEIAKERTSRLMRQDSESKHREAFDKALTNARTLTVDKAKADERLSQLRKS